MESNAKNITSYLGTIINNIPYKIFWKDKNSVFLGCNLAFAISAGFKSPEEMVGKTDYDLPWTKAESDSYIADDRQVIVSKKPKLNIEESQTSEDGTELVILTSKIPLFDNNGEVTSIVCIYSDITARKKMEIDLLNAKERAEYASEVKTRFIQNIEHDLRTPFCGVWGLTDILAEKETDPDKKETLRIISGAAKELLDYHNEILDFSNIEIGTHSVLKKKLELKKILQSVISIEKPAANLKKLDLLFEYDEKIPKNLLSDEYRLKRIIINLISNSIKFTKKGYIKLSASIAKKIDKSHIILELSVTDTGLGIDKENENFIYQKFAKVNASNKGLYKGVGLGLTIFKQFVEDLGGEIELESEPGKGSKFSCFIEFKIPLLEQ